MYLNILCFSVLMDQRVIDFMKSESLIDQVIVISNILQEYDRYRNDLSRRTVNLENALVRCGQIMESFLDKSTQGGERNVLKNMMIFELRDDLQGEIIRGGIGRTVLFNIEEEKFKEVFGQELHLKTRGEGRVLHPYDNNYGPARNYHTMDPVAPRGYEYSRNSNLSELNTIETLPMISIQK